MWRRAPQKTFWPTVGRLLTNRLPTSYRERTNRLRNTRLVVCVCGKTFWPTVGQLMANRQLSVLAGQSADRFFRELFFTNCTMVHLTIDPLGQILSTVLLIYSSLLAYFFKKYVDNNLISWGRPFKALKSCHPLSIFIIKKL